MRSSLFVGAALSLSPALGFAQQCDAPAICAPAVCAPQCSTPQLNSAPAQPNGNFTRGPATGQRAGASRSLGIRGPALHIPEVRIALPTLEFPSPVRFVRDAEMLFDPNRGAFSSAAVQDFGTIENDGLKNAAPQGNNNLNPAGSTPCYMPKTYCPPACAVPAGHSADTADLRLEATLVRLEALEAELANLRSVAARAATAEVPPSPQASTNGAQKPGTAPAPVFSSRPVPAQKFVQAGYEEPVAAETAPRRPAAPVAAPHRQLPTGHFGLSSPRPIKKTAEADEFGAWSRSTSRQ